MITKFIDAGKIIGYDGVLSDNECNELIATIESSTNFITKSGGRQVSIRDISWLSQKLESVIQLPPYVYKSCKLYTLDPHNTDFNYWLTPQINTSWALIKSPVGSSLSLHLDGMIVKTINCASFYTIFCYLNDNDGATFFEKAKVKIEARKGRVIIFDQSLLHQGLVNTQCVKYAARSEILYTRSKTFREENDSTAVELYNKQMVDKAFEMSPALEELVLNS